jgi:chemotaxis protein MotB
MFDVGSVDLTPRGRVILGKIAPLMEELDGYLIGIIGNADSKPIVTPALKKKYPTNWELSSHRGAAVVRFFLDEANVDPRRMIAMGLGEYQPIDTNLTVEGRSNNRRIDIVLLPIDAMAAIILGAEVK